MNATQPLLRVEGLGKSFPGVRALHNLEFDILPGEVHALVGQNGAGKSTFIKILTGRYRSDTGSIFVDGEPVDINDVAAARDSRIAVIHQDLNLVPAMSVAENVHLGHRTVRQGIFVDWRLQRREAQRIFEEMKVDIDVTVPVRDLSLAMQQMVAVARAIVLDPRIMIMDEPTAALGVEDAELVFALVRRLRQQGRSVVYVSHRLEEVMVLSDRITILRDGQRVGTYPIHEVPSQHALVEMIIGRASEELVRAGTFTPGEVVLDVEGLSRAGAVRDATFSVRAGEVLGIAGLVGSGRTELARLIFGADRADGGTVRMHGHEVHFHSPADAIAAGVALLPEDRRGQAAIMNMNLRENLSLASLSTHSRAGFVSRKSERMAYRAAAQNLRIKAPDSETPISHLSGGNQQKVVIGKWLETDASLLILDEPTQGIDVGAQEEIHALMRRLAAEGRAIVFISSDLEETLRVSDRVLVMRAGAVVAELDDATATLPNVLRHCFGTADIPEGLGAGQAS